MRRMVWGMVVLAVSTLPVLAEEPARLRWDHEGYAALPDAAAKAHAAGHRMLLGLSGSPT